MKETKERATRVAQSVPVTRTWASRIAAHRFEHLSPVAVESALKGIADTVGCIVAGAATDIGRAMRAFCMAESGKCRVWPDGRTSARGAALANGAMGHAHDIDDSSESMRGHPSVPVVPALLAVADAERYSGADLIAAYVIGVEIEGKIGRATITSHPERGWHTTLTLGTLGATAAVSNLMRLPEEKVLNALGIAVSMCSGVRVNFGTQTKPLHAGIAAHNGILATQLAMLGVEASPVAIEGYQGFFDVFAGYEGTDASLAVTAIGEPWEVIDAGLDFKLYPSCSLSHPPLDIVLGGIRDGSIDPDDIEEVRCGVGYRLLTNMPYERPETGLQGKFSMNYCIAAALRYGRCSFEQFTDEAVADEKLRALLNRVKVYVHPDLQGVDSLSRDFSDIEVIHRSGRRFHRRLEKSKGHPTNPMSWDEHREKFLACTDLALSRAQGEELWERVRHLDRATQASL